jgi:hypothetical protein
MPDPRRLRMSDRRLPARFRTVRGLLRHVLDQFGRGHAKSLHQKKDERNAQGKLVDGSHDGVLTAYEIRIPARCREWSGGNNR